MVAAPGPVVRPVRVGEGAAAALTGDAPGRVVAVFRRAVYLSYPRGLLALVGTDAEPGPLHAHVAALPSVAVGDVLDVPGCAEVWRPPPFPPVAEVVGVLADVLDHRPDLDLGGAPGDDITQTLRRRGLATAAALLAGRGIGLTPAGDDVLAGLLLAARAAGHPERDLLALASGARTHEISRAFLGWAARGRSVAALHDLAAACAAGDAPAARRARTRLAAVGHTSGLDLAHGFLIGCRHERACTDERGHA
jgi:hypothetical protein